MGAIALAGCSDTPAPADVDPDRLLLDQALLAESALLAVLGQPRTLAELGDALHAEAENIVNQHLERLSEILGSSPQPSASESGDGASFVLAARATAHSHLNALEIAGPSAAQLLASLGASDLVLATAARSEQPDD